MCVLVFWGSLYVTIARASTIEISKPSTQGVRSFGVEYEGALGGAEEVWLEIHAKQEAGALCDFYVTVDGVFVATADLEDVASSSNMTYPLAFIVPA